MKLNEGTVDLTREFAHPATAVFAAWSEEAAQKTWGDPGAGWHLTFDRFRFRVGESDICRFGPLGGAVYINENRYLAIEPERLIMYASSLRSADKLTFAGTVAVTLDGTAARTRLRLVEQGLYLDGQDSVDGHRAGWDGMLDALGAYLDDVKLSRR